MHAAIFDIDGTLLDSCVIDDEFYVEAIRRVLGPVHIREAWARYTNVSDTGILAEICADNSLHYDDDLSEAVMEVFVAQLSAHITTNGPSQPIAGALAYFRSLQRRADVRVAYATGGWRRSAQLKLSSAGFPLEGIPLASANDHQDRTQIMLQALGQFVGPFHSVTYFGDGIWDREAAAALGWEFVPVGPKLRGLMDYSAGPPDTALRLWTRRQYC